MEGSPSGEGKAIDTSAPPSGPVLGMGAAAARRGHRGHDGQPRGRSPTAPRRPPRAKRSKARGRKPGGSRRPRRGRAPRPRPSVRAGAACRSAPAPWRRAFSTRLSSAWRSRVGSARATSGGRSESTTTGAVELGRTRGEGGGHRLHAGTHGDGSGADRQRLLVEPREGQQLLGQRDEAVGLLGGRRRPRAGPRAIGVPPPRRARARRLQDG